MIVKPTVLVLGAGASAPYGLPTGSELREKILNEHSDADKFAFGNCIDPHEAQKGFRAKLKGSRVGSIDAFLQRADEHNRRIGKLLIAAHIALSEDPEQMFPSKQDWIETWFEILSRDANADKFLKNNKLTVVTFNYDRSYEYAIYLYLINRYGMHPPEAVTRVNALPIIHIHGSLGPLEDQNANVGREYIPKLWGLNREESLFRLIDEQPKEHNELRQAHSALELAYRVVILGFGFHEINCKRLFKVSRNDKSKWRGCRFGLTDDVCKVAARDIPVNPHASSEDNKHILFGKQEWDARQFLLENYDFLID